MELPWTRDDSRCCAPPLSVVLLLASFSLPVTFNAARHHAGVGGRGRLPDSASEGAQQVCFSLGTLGGSHSRRAAPSKTERLQVTSPLALPPSATDSAPAPPSVDPPSLLHIYAAPLCDAAAQIWNTSRARRALIVRRAVGCTVLAAPVLAAPCRRPCRPSPSPPTSASDPAHAGPGAHASGRLLCVLLWLRFLHLVCRHLALLPPPRAAAAAGHVSLCGGAAAGLCRGVQLCSGQACAAAALHPGLCWQRSRLVSGCAGWDTQANHYGACPLPAHLHSRSYMLHVCTWGAAATQAGAGPAPLKRWAMWRAVAAYFPARLHKTADLPPHRPCEEQQKGLQALPRLGATTAQRTASNNGMLGGSPPPAAARRRPGAGPCFRFTMLPPVPSLLCRRIRDAPPRHSLLLGLAHLCH